jgi:hypothetical protein
MKYGIIAALVLVSRIAAAQELSIKYQYNTAGPDSGNFLSFKSPLRYVAVEKDTFDGVSGASKFKSTTLFSPIQTDMTGKATFPSGLRGLLLYPVSSYDLCIEDNLRVSKGSNGVITIMYAHRGTAYRISTDRNGQIGLPRGNFLLRAIGYIEGHNPQVIAKDFSSTGGAAGIDWNRVWDAKVAGGKEVSPGVAARTGTIQNDYGDLTAMFNWDGTLNVTYNEPILTITGSLKSVKR